VYDKDPRKPKKTKPKKTIFVRSPGGDSDLAPESDVFVCCFFGSLAVWGGDSDLAPESEMFGFFSFFCFFGSLVVWVCTEKHVFA